VVDNGVKELNIQFHNPRVVVVRTAPRIGPGKSRNIGARSSDTKYIAFLDDDDWWDSGYIENTIKKFEDTNADVVIGQLKRYGIGGEFKWTDAYDKRAITIKGANRNDPYVRYMRKDLEKN